MHRNSNIKFKVCFWLLTTEIWDESLSVLVGSVVDKIALCLSTVVSSLSLSFHQCAIFLFHSYIINAVPAWPSCSSSWTVQISISLQSGVFPLLAMDIQDFCYPMVWSPVPIFYRVCCTSVYVFYTVHLAVFNLSNKMWNICFSLPPAPKPHPPKSLAYVCDISYLNL